MIRSVVQTNENNLELNLDYMTNAVAVLSLSFQFFNCLMGQLHGEALPF